MKNLLEPTTADSDIEYKSDRNDDHVYTMMKLIEQCEADPRRKHRLSSLKENKGLKEQKNTNLMDMSSAYGEFRNAPTPPLIKASLYDQFYRKSFSQNIKVMKVMAEPSGEYEKILPFVNAAKDAMLRDCDMEGVHREIFNCLWWQGPAFVQVSFNAISETVENRVLNYDECYFDSTAKFMTRPGKAQDQTVRWFAHKRTQSRGAFDEYLKAIGKDDLVGKIPSGDPLSTVQSEDEKDLSIQFDQPVTTYRIYSIQAGNVFEMEVAGGMATIIYKNEESEYKHKRYGKPVIPVACWSLDPESELYSRSYMDYLKDGAEALKKIVNTFLLSIGRRLNPWRLLLGDATGKMVEDMKVFNTMSDVGVTPLISSSNRDIDIKSVAPDSLYQDFQEARNAILDEKGSQLGVQFRVQEKTSEKATIWIEQRKDESEASQQYKKNNSRAYQFQVGYSFTLYIKDGELDTVGYVEMPEDGLFASEVVDPELLRVLLEEWKGEFIVDDSTDEKLTTAEEIRADDNIDASLLNLVSMVRNLGITEMEGVKGNIDILMSKIMKLKREKILSRSDIEKQIMHQIKNNKALTNAQDEPQTEQGIDSPPPIDGANLPNELKAEQIPQGIVRS